MSQVSVYLNLSKLSQFFLLWLHLQFIQHDKYTREKLGHERYIKRLRCVVGTTVTYSKGSGLDSGPEARYPDRASPWFASVPPGKFFNTLEFAAATPFHSLLNLQLTVTFHSTVQNLQS
jgi:hypothetical protein